MLLYVAVVINNGNSSVINYFEGGIINTREEVWAEHSGMCGAAPPQLGEVGRRDGNARTTPGTTQALVLLCGLPRRAPSKPFVAVALPWGLSSHQATR